MTGLKGKNTSLFCAVMVALALIASACAPVAPAQPTEPAGPAATSPAVARPAAGGTVNVYLYQKPKNFNPLLPFHGPDQQLMQLVFDNLVIVNDRYEYEGRLAEKWQISSDAKTYTFTLRNGLKWSDGQPFSSKDVLFTYKLLAPRPGSSAA
jgi:ABC-type transport system substrate-binding protein